MNLLQWAGVFVIGCVVGYFFCAKHYRKKTKGMITRQRAKQGACDGIDNIKE